MIHVLASLRIVAGSHEPLLLDNPKSHALAHLCSICVSHYTTRVIIVYRFVSFHATASLDWLQSLKEFFINVLILVASLTLMALFSTEPSE